MGRSTLPMLISVVSTAVVAQRYPPRIFSPGVISGSANDLSPAFTPDGRTVFFTRSNSSQSTILISHLSAGTWSKPQIASFSGEWLDLEPTMAPDGSYLIFISSRPTVSGGKPIDGFYNGAAQPGRGGNLWRVDHTSSGWASRMVCRTSSTAIRQSTRQVLRHEASTSFNLLAQE